MLRSTPLRTVGRRLGLMVAIALVSAACQATGNAVVAPVDLAGAALAAPVETTLSVNAESTVRPAPTAAETVATQYLVARDHADAHQASALFADDAITVDSPLVTLDRQAEVFALFDVLDWRWTIDECTETVSEPPAEVTCTYATENAWSRALGVAPVDGQIRFAIEDGRIINMWHDFNRAQWSTRVERVFQAWLTNNHPADVATMWEPEGFTRADDDEYGLDERLIPRLTAESLDLYARYADEFAEAAG